MSDQKWTDWSSSFHVRESEVTAQILISAPRHKKPIFIFFPPHPFFLVPKAGPLHSLWMLLTFKADGRVWFFFLFSFFLPLAIQESNHSHTRSETHTAVTEEPFIAKKHAGNLAAVTNLYVINAMFVVCFCRMVLSHKGTEMKLKGIPVVCVELNGVMKSC